MAGKEAIALQLEEAKRDLEAQIRQALRTYEQQVKGAMELDLNLEAERGDDEEEVGEKERALRNMVRSLVAAFHQRDVVRRTGVRVYKVTAIDSDADGEAALNVKYEYAVDTGMGEGTTSPETLRHLPRSSADE